MKNRGKLFRWITIGIILILDILILPSIIKLPFYIMENKMQGPSMWIQDLNPWSAFTNLFVDIKSLQFFITLQGLVLVLCLLAFWDNRITRKNRVMDGVEGPEAAGSGQHGTSRWQTEEETDRCSTVWKLGKQLTKGGTVLGMDPEQKKAWLDTDDTHKLIIGTTRSGKTRTVVYPTIYALSEAGESMILTDPKGELYGRTSDHLKRKGYEVVVLDFIEPGRGNRWNVLENVLEALREGNQTAAAEAAWNTAHLLAHQKDSKGDSIWVDGSESVIAALIFAIATEAQWDDQKHMTSVYKTLAELGEVQKVKVAGSLMEFVPLNEYFKHLPKDHPARDAYATARLSPEKMRGSFFGTVSVMLRLFSDPGVAYLTSSQDHRLEDVGAKKTAVFLIIPDENTTRHPLAALYVDQTYQALVKLSRKTRNRLPVRVHMLLDEFGNMPQFKDFITKLTVSGGRGILWNLVVQGIGQIKKIYGADSLDTILGNCHTTIYILTGDEGTAKKLSFLTGQYTVETDNISSSSSGRSQSTTGRSTTLMGRALRTPDEIMRWPKEMSLLIRLREYPAKLSCPDVTKWPCDELFNWREDNDDRTIKKVPIFIPDMNGSDEREEEVPGENRDEEDTYSGYRETDLDDID
ncbi:VirD4-like conjugal transfer protein, CD1115 family [Paenibacillus chitinolyticus]|uniref:VirD4-like conjugal transfer protein, CD1115 family n=1 Tax=Paenibacillus chitinolyticus TaxID=79263 RepID=UPI001C481DC3|nr:type IV secretory system conjugative DNA transfer family protein [Paenibacillus chitinolyticus]MBV6717199.1 type IV secretory system conjugative DNA transfer family protein [Paenibacillus chitinolyticus]